MLQDNEKKGSRQAMSEDIITRILDRNNLNEAFKNVKANKGASGIDELSIEETTQYIRENPKSVDRNSENRKNQMPEKQNDQIDNNNRQCYFQSQFSLKPLFHAVCQRQEHRQREKGRHNKEKLD